jgi:membrane-bound lytic murein transglycosylase MltF
MSVAPPAGNGTIKRTGRVRISNGRNKTLFFLPPRTRDFRLARRFSQNLNLDFKIIVSDPWSLLMTPLKQQAELPAKLPAAAAR